jgi:AraC-like DNA-binding protein
VLNLTDQTQGTDAADLPPLKALAGARDRFVTRDPAAVSRHILDMTRGHCRFSVRDASKFEGFRDALAYLGQTKLQLLRWDGESECRTAITRPADYHAVLHIPLRGGFDASSERAHVAVRPGQMLLVSTTGSIHRQWHGPCELLNVVVDRKLLERALASEAGVIVDEELVFQPLALTDVSMALALARFIDLVWRDLNGPARSFAHPALGRQGEKTLLLLLLKSLPHNYSDRMEHSHPEAAPLYVKRVEEYIRRRAREEITLDDLVAVGGASLRSLHYGFRMYRGTTPMKHLKQVRLRLARAALIEAHRAQAHPAGGLVTRIAVEAGYCSLSQFSRDYKACFGERARDTLRQA